MKKNAINFAIAFVLALASLGLAWIVLVHPCNVYTPNIDDEKRCNCLGKTVNFNNWLGKFEPDRQVHHEACVGVVRKVVK